jgi:serine/threonine-protein kinase
MDLYCTRPGCPRPSNSFSDLDDPAKLKAVAQKYCTSCGMPLILDNRYIPVRLLGQGGFGAAFLAHDRRRPGFPQCVVKQFQPSGNLTPTQLKTAQQLFEREAEVLERLGNDHPYIPDLFASFNLIVPSLQPHKQDELFYLVQEYIDGETLEEEVQHEGALPPERIQGMLNEVLEILDYVHTQNVIHRDIKPSNIMHHSSGRYYLLDFGAVRLATKGSTSGKSTGIYSLGYAPPEQMAGGEVFPSTDLYALAVTAVIMLTAKEPNELLDGYSNTWKWRSHAPQVGDHLASILDRMLRSTPSERFQSAKEVLEALRQPAPLSTTMQPATSPTLSTPAPTLQGKLSPPTRPPRLPPVAPFSVMELLLNAGFTGFEGSLLAIALLSLLGTTLISGGFWIALLGLLIFAQSRRFIERLDLLIIAGVTLVVVVAVPALHRLILIPGGASTLITVVVVAAMVGLLAIAATALFRLIYLLLSRTF